MKLSGKTALTVVVDENCSHMEQFVKELASGLFDSTGEVVHDQRNQIKSFEVAGMKVVAKRFRRPHTFNRIMYSFFRGSKASRAYRNAVRLRKLGVQTPEPIAFAEVKEKGLITDTYYVSGYTDYEPLKTALAPAFPEREIVLDAFVKYSVWLHNKGVKHNDYNYTNILYKQDPPSGYLFELIDINRMKFVYMNRWRCNSNFVRFCSSTKDPLSPVWIGKPYAEERGWNPDVFVNLLNFKYAWFEGKRTFRRGLKRILRRNKRN